MMLGPLTMNKRISGIVVTVAVTLLVLAAIAFGPLEDHVAGSKARFAAGEIRLVRGLGLADEMLQIAFDVVSRKLRRAESALPGFMRDVPGARSPGSMSPGA